jgi:hypothetical protein
MHERELNMDIYVATRTPTSYEDGVTMVIYAGTDKERAIELCNESKGVYFINVSLWVNGNFVKHILDN